jgi:hypothetical protein
MTMHLPPNARQQLQQGADDNTAEAARLLLEENNTAAARKHLEWAQLAGEVIKRERKPPHTLYLAGGFALLCLSLVGLSWSISKGDNPILLDLEVDSFSLHLPQAWHGDNLDITTQHLSVDNIERIQAGGLGIDAAFEFLEAEGPALALHQLHLAQGAEVEVRGTTRGFSLFIKNTTVEGSLQVHRAWIKLAGDNNLIEQDIHTPSNALPPEFIRFNGVSGGKWNVPVRLDAEIDTPWRLARMHTNHLNFSREEPPGSGQTFSTIRKGRLKLPEVGRDIELFEADILELSNVRSARLIIEGSDKFVRLQFQGEVDRIRAGPEGFVKDHTPAWLEYFYYHKQLAFFWSALVFLWGLLWKLRSFW